MPICSVCETLNDDCRDEVIYTMNRETWGGGMGGGTRLEDVKEHIYKVCEPCYGKRKTLGIVLGLLMIPIAGYGIYSIWNSKTYDTGIPVLELGLMFGFMLLGWVLLSKVSGLTKLKRLALKERNIPGYSAMPKGQYDAFCKAASWNK